MDGTAVETDSSMISGGAQIKFKAAGSQIMIFILESGDDYDYDCFVDGISVKNGAPFEVNGYTFTKALSWKQKRLANKNKYILVEALKGIIAGCVIFLALYFVQYISTAFYHIFDAHWGIFMIASLFFRRLFSRLLRWATIRKMRRPTTNIKNISKNKSEASLCP